VSDGTGRVDVLFLHGSGDDYLVVATRDGERLFRAVLEVHDTDAGPRPARFRVRRGSASDPRSPDQFVELARRAGRVRISQQTPTGGRQELQELLSGYQLEAKVVRTCRLCAAAGRYSPISEETAIRSNGEDICPDCGKRELERELSFSGGLSTAARERLEELLL